jgi:hypothetical protein
MDNNNQMLGGSAVETNNQSSNFSDNISGTMNESENFTSSSDNYVNNTSTYGAVNNGAVNHNQTDYTTTSTTNANGGSQHETVGYFPGGSLKREVKTIAKELFGMGRHKKGCQHGGTTTTTSTCTCTDQATCPHRTQNSSYAVGENCACNETDTYNSSTLSDNKTSNFASSNQVDDSYKTNVNGGNGATSTMNNASDSYNDTETFSGQASGGFSNTDSYMSNEAGAQSYSNGGPVGGNAY